MRSNAGRLIRRLGSARRRVGIMCRPSRLHRGDLAAAKIGASALYLKRCSRPQRVEVTVARPEAIVYDEECAEMLEGVDESARNRRLSFRPKVAWAGPRSTLSKLISAGADDELKPKPDSSDRDLTSGPTGTPRAQRSSPEGLFRCLAPRKIPYRPATDDDRAPLFHSGASSLRVSLQTAATMCCGAASDTEQTRLIQRSGQRMPR